MDNIKTLVIGASTNPDRYSFKAIQALRRHGHEVVALGLREGEVAGVPIVKARPENPGADTVTLYVGAKHQPEFYDYLLQIKPRRVIFNPGAENSELETLLRQNSIEPVEACTLVMLATGQY